MTFERPMQQSSQFLRIVLLAGFFSLISGLSPASRAEGLPIAGTAHPLPASITTADNAPKTFLMPEEAFGIQVAAQDAGHLIIRFTPAPGYYLYRDRIHVQADGKPAALHFPQAESKQDPSFGQVWIYHHPFDAVADVANASPAKVSVNYQGCAEHGICYPPTTRDFEQKGPQGGYQVTALNDPLSPPPPDAHSSNPEDYLNYLRDAKPSWVMLSFYGFGLLLALTPCVFPMIPILSGIIAGEGTRLTRTRGFILSLTYVLGMAVTYTAAGVLAGLSGTLLSNTLQTPPVQTVTALLFVLLALSMFDVYQLQVPVGLQTHLNTLSGRLPGGKYLGVGLMGALSALVVGPCVAAPLAGGLLYIAQTRNVLLGGGALFFMALGMGSPLLIIGTSAGALLPKAGKWMNWIKRFFGVALLGVALWMVLPLLPGIRSSSASLPFETVSSMAQLDQDLDQAARNHQPVLLDFYADWCVSCVEIDHSLLPDPSVRQALQGVRLLRADVTHNTADDQALLARFGLFGPPGMVFFKPSGEEQSDQRLVGYISPVDFVRHLHQAFE